MLSSGVPVMCGLAISCGIARLSEELHHFHREFRVLYCHLVATEREVFGVFLLVLIETFLMHVISEESRKVK